LTFKVFDFSSEFLHEMDFGADFSFGGDSFLPKIEVNFFKNTSLLGEDLFAYNDVSISHLVESIVSIGSPEKKGQKRKKRSPNRTSYRASVRTSCWYKNFYEPGQIRETTHMLSSSNPDGKFCHWFRMPLSKVEELTTKLVLRGCVREPRTHWQKQEFRDCAELLVMSALYILVHGASFHSLRPLCHMSKSECTIFFHVFIDEMYNMRNEFVCMPKNASELAPITRGYKNPACRDVVGRWMLFTCSGCSVPPVT
jgi:hypothetical protein